MKNYKSIQEFEKEYKKLKKRFPSLEEDFQNFQAILEQFPTGTGSKFVQLHDERDVIIIKARFACRCLRDSSLRIIYAWHKQKITFVYIELYFKGDKTNEDRKRILEYMKTIE